MSIVSKGARGAPSPTYDAGIPACFQEGVGLESQPTGAGRDAVVMGTDSEMKMLLLENFSNSNLGGEAKPPSKSLLEK